MVATTTRPAEAQRLVRFDRTERWLHWANATLVGVLVATAAVLYWGELSSILGRRALFKEIHVIAGLCLPVPFLLALPGRRGRRLRRDLGALNRFSADDLRWLRSRGADPTVRLGKFNPGQKLNASFVAGVIVVMLATGSIMNWFHYFPVDWRTGATFVHDWVAVILFVVVVGHIGMAFADPDSLGSMLGGTIDAGWARDKRPRWYEEEQRVEGQSQE